MLNQEQTEKAGRVLAVAAEAKDVFDYEYEEFELTRQTVDEFVAARGRVHETREIEGVTVSIWRQSQAHKGDRRRDVYVADFGDARAVYTF